MAEEQATEVKVRAETELAEERARLEEKSDAEILQELGLKDPDEMQAGDDFAAFLKAAVPDRLRRRALRRLWLSNPVLANLDSLVDYGEDYTDAATVVENLQTAIQLGRGALDRVEAHVMAAGDEAASEAGEKPFEPELAKPERLETESFRPETTANASNCGTLTMETGPGEAKANVSVQEADRQTAFRAEVGPEAEANEPRPRRMKFQFLD